MEIFSLRFRAALAATAALASVVIAAPAASFPIGFSVNGGAGISYYSMHALNDYFAVLAHENKVTTTELTNGMTLMACGRLWFFDRIALAGGYEHSWAQVEIEAESANLSVTAPVNIISIGAIGTVYAFPNVVSINIGVNYCFAKANFGATGGSTRRLRESTGDDDGYQVFTEVHTNCLKPVEIGFQLGYRGVRIKTFATDNNEIAVLAPGVKADADYSGVYFYLMAGIRL